MAIPKIRLLVVDDSIFFRTALTRALESDTAIEIVGTAVNAFDAERKIKELSPDVVTLDVEMPGMRGTDFLKKIIPTNPLPVVLVSAVNIGVFEALDAGAVDFVRKPDMQNQNNFSSFCMELATKVKIASTAKVRKLVPVATTAETPASLPLPKVGSIKRHVVAIGASTGGTEATLEILKQIPEECPGIIVVQHMPVGFTKMYADRLNRICKITVSEAQNGDRVLPGHALIAPGDKHMTLERDPKGGYFVRCTPGEKVSGHCPSVDVLFDSVAKKAAPDSVGVILTGMGRDGAAGLLGMRQRGAYTIGQDQESCVVYGMPMEAFKLGAVMKQAPCSDIARLILQAVNR